MFKRVGMLAAGIALVIVLLLSISVLSGTALRAARMDLTENKLYTLSEGTRAVLAKLEEPVALRLYFSKDQAADYPHILSYYQRVEELLLEYVHHAGGKLTLESLDPEPFTETEDRAVAYGLRGAPSGAGELIYFGLAGSNTLGDEEIIPFFDTSKEAYLEYDLSKLVHQLSNPGKITVGMLSSLPIEGGPSNPFMGPAADPWFVVDHLRQLFEVRTLMPGAGEIPDDIGVLVLVHPKDLPEVTLYAIDQFVLGGGKVIAFVDPYCEADQPPADPQNPLAAMMAPRASSLGALFDAWGVELVAEQLAADRASALSVTWNNRGRPEPIDYVLYQQLGPEQFNADELASRDLAAIRLGTPGFLRPIPEAKTALTHAAADQRGSDADPGQLDPVLAGSAQAPGRVRAHRHALHARRAHQRPGRQRLPLRPPARRARSGRRAGAGSDGGPPAPRPSRSTWSSWPTPTCSPINGGSACRTSPACAWPTRRPTTATSWST